MFTWLLKRNCNHKNFDFCTSETTQQGTKITLQHNRSLQIGVHGWSSKQSQARKVESADKQLKTVQKRRYGSFQKATYSVLLFRLKDLFYVHRSKPQIYHTALQTTDSDERGKKLHRERHISAEQQVQSFICCIQADNSPRRGRI